MQEIQLSLFPESKEDRIEKQKKAKLGRYERIKRELEANNHDTSKIFVEIESPPAPILNYKFVDLFCGAGGMTQGLLKAGFQPIASVEVNPIASATYTKNFQKCHHFCGDIETFNPKDWLKNLCSAEVHLVVGGPPCQGFLLPENAIQMTLEIAYFKNSYASFQKSVLGMLSWKMYQGF